MSKLKKPDQKTLELKRTGTLNPRPDSVSDTLFKENPFFDPRDFLQTRYEMLRRHSVEGGSIRSETDWSPQPSPRLCFRHSVQRESILRSQGFSPNSLRDAAPAQRGGSLDQI